MVVSDDRSRPRDDLTVVGDGNLDVDDGRPPWPAWDPQELAPGADGSL